MLTVHQKMEQRSAAWFAARCGIVTASAVGKLLTLESPSPLTVVCPKCKAGEQTQCMSLARKEPTPVKTFHRERDDVVANLPRVVQVASNDTARGVIGTLVAERITGEIEETFINADMERGIDHEPIARARYAEVNAVEVAEVGFMVADLFPGQRLGYSPDGLVGDDGLIEIKCPRAKGHVQTILADEVPSQYVAQLQAGLLVSGRKWIDYVSFCAGMPLYIKRVTPDRQWQQAITGAVTAFEKTAEQMVSDYLKRVETLPATDRIIDVTDWSFAS